MGLRLFKNCSSVRDNISRPAPNPDSSRWQLLDRAEFANGYVLKVRYLDCTNYEGVKIMVYRGSYRERTELDPHFRDNPASPIARFRPDSDGWEYAKEFAKAL